MTLSLTSNSGKQPRNKQSSLFPGDKVYLYGDTTYRGRLIHPVEHTYPPKWTVQLDRGGYEAVNIKYITVVKSRNNQYSVRKENHCYESNLEIPKGDDICESANSKTFELEQKIAALKRENALLQGEKEIIQQQCRELEQENKILKKDLECAKQIIRRAKDISPVMRLSLKRVLRLAHHACMDLERTVGGWILKMGDKARKFRRLADIWDLLSQDEFILSEIFPPEKLIAVDLIQPPKRRKRPKPPEKKTRPLMPHGHPLAGETAKQVRPSYPPEDVIRNRTMLLVQSG